ncbi:MAG: hypothetical protein ABIV47_02170 [Roseiflexaceae bacterium]
MQPERKQGNQNAVDLAVDIVIFLIFLAVEAPKFSGLPAHEWLGIAIGAGALTHVLLLFLAITTIIFTGLMISAMVMPLLGITVAQNGLWRGLHTGAANMFILLVVRERFTS